MYVIELISRIETVREAIAKYEQTFSFFFTAVPSSVTKACDWAFMASLTCEHVSLGLFGTGIIILFSS